MDRAGSPGGPERHQSGRWLIECVPDDRPFGEYDSKVLDRISQRLSGFLEAEAALETNNTGRVTARFQLHPDAQISDLQITRNTAGDTAGSLCQRAITESVPFAPWTKQMRQELANGVHGLSLTFYLRKRG
jgi:hypothetical protein